MVKTEGEAQLLRIHVAEDDRYDGTPLYEAIVLKARDMGIAGATVYRGVLGYGASAQLHTSKVLRLSEDMPMIVELVDQQDKINEMLPVLDEMVSEGLVTLEKVRVIMYREGKSD